MMSLNPVVAEIIDIFEPIDAAINQGFQAEAFGSINLALIENIVGIGFAINLVADPELEQVRVTPSHRHLNDFVQRDQGRRRRDVGASPYPRLRVPKLNQYPGDRLNHRVLGARQGFESLGCAIFDASQDKTANTISRRANEPSG